MSARACVGDGPTGAVWHTPSIFHLVAFVEFVPNLLQRTEVVMARNIIVTCSVVGISVLGLMAFAGNEDRAPKHVGTIRIEPTMTSKGPAVRVTAGDCVFFAPSLVLPAQEKTKWAEITTGGDKLVVPRILLHSGATGTLSVNTVTISTDSEQWRAHAGLTP